VRPSVQQPPTLIELTTTNKKAARRETAIRAWARLDGKLARALAEIDHKHLAYEACLLVATPSETGPL
jgi:hypothetical protein